MRISDWSSDVCSSDLGTPALGRLARPGIDQVEGIPRHGLRSRGDGGARLAGIMGAAEEFQHIRIEALHADRQPVDAGRGKGDRKSVVSGTSVSVRVDLGGRRIIKKKKTITHMYNVNAYNNQPATMTPNYTT